MSGDSGSIRIAMDIDQHNQWFISLFVLVNGVLKPVRFKIDTGCNALVLSHKTLQRLGKPTDTSTLSKLPELSGKLASGEKNIFKKLGNVTLFQDSKQSVQICNANVICHATKQTNNLLGTEVLHQFAGVSFRIKGNKYLELSK